MSQSELPKLDSVILPMLAVGDAEHRRLRRQIQGLMCSAFKHAGVSLVRRRLGSQLLMWRMKAAARRGRSLRHIEVMLRPRFKRTLTEAEYYAAQKKRAARAFERIKDYLVGEHLLDLGSGPGLIAQTVRERTGMKVTLADVIDCSMTDLPTTIIPEGGPIPLENRSVDTTLIYVVLHHADDPLRLLDEAVRVTRTRIIIMEGYVDDEGSRRVNCFFDWFLNRVVQGNNINIPLNYRTTAEWRQIFAERGLQVARQELVGIDEPMAPESHVLFVLDRATQPQAPPAASPSGSAWDPPRPRL
ncbi:MAG: class I SAM-dependent methyltransferase [Acidobacteria bacterium]|nr:class I SAM-dependent methyltransferase [Acidobacteriota bacterium]